MNRVWIVFVLVATALAGCTSEETATADGAIEIVTMPADGLSPLALASTVVADEYSWSMGDGRAPVMGKEIEHVYGVTDGTFKVTLTTKMAGEKTVWEPLEVILGTGINTAPTISVSLNYNWVQVGEEFTLSVGTEDAEGDPVLAQWFCSKKSDIGPAGGDDHGGGGVAFGTGSTSVVNVLRVNETELPPADRTVEGDLCANMPTPAYTDGASISGAFEERGIYELTLLAKDPANAGVPGIFTIYVTDEPRANKTQLHVFEGTISRGAPESADGPLATAGDEEHIVVHRFPVDFAILGGSFSLSNDGGNGAPVSIEYDILRGSTRLVGPTSEDSNAEPAWKTGQYSAVVKLRTGVNVGYTMTATYEYETNPAKLFEAPGGH